MSAFKHWLLSAATAQQMIAGRHAILVSEARALWDGPHVLKDLGAQRNRLVRLSKRAKRAMPGWHNSLEERLRAPFNRKATVRARSAVEAILQEARIFSEQILQHPPLIPVPTMDRRSYRSRMQPLTPAQRRVVISALRSVPPAMGELLADQLRNGWLAAVVVDLFLDPAFGVAGLEPWISDWAQRAHISLAPDELKNWKAWLGGHHRVPPELTASLVGYRLGLVGDAMSEVEFTAAQGEDEGPSLPGSRAAVDAIDPSKVYTLKQASRVFNLKAWTIRDAVRRNELKCSRPTASSNAPIQLRDTDIRDWLASRTGRHQHAERSPNLKAKSRLTE